MEITTNINYGFWETFPCTITPMADRDVYTFYYEGFYDTLKAELAYYMIGDVFINEPDGDDSIPSGSVYQNGLVVTGLSLTRKVAGLGELQIQVSALYKRDIWNIDFAEVSKDIRTWLVKKYTDSLGNVQKQVWNELGFIRQWEAEKEGGNYVEWAEFKYRDSSDAWQTLTGDTKKLAEKMMRGVETYSTYWPVITRTTLRPFLPVVGQIGKKCSPVYESGWVGFNNEPLPQDWLDLAKEWLKTAERSSSNSDGTFGLVEQWQGVDMIDNDLYESA